MPAPHPRQKISNANSNIIVKLFASAMESKYPVEASKPTNDDNEVCNYLLKILGSIMRSSTFVLDERSTLMSHDLNDEDIDVDYSEIENLTHDNSTFTYEYMKTVADFADCAKHRSFKSIQHTFPLVKDKCYVCRFRKYISEKGTTAQKI